MISTTYKTTVPVPVQVTTKTTTVNEVYPKGVAVPVGMEATAFAPPQRRQKFIAADALKRKNTNAHADSRVVVAKENNSAASSPRVIVR